MGGGSGSRKFPPHGNFRLKKQNMFRLIKKKNLCYPAVTAELGEGDQLKVKLVPLKKIKKENNCYPAVTAELGEELQVGVSDTYLHWERN